MNIVKHGLLFSLSLTQIIMVQGQTAEEIINKHFDAVGGKDRISMIKSIYTESSVSVQGNEAPSTITILNGKGYRLESEFNGQKIIQVYTDRGGWTVNPMAGANEPKSLPEDQYKAGKDQIDVGGPLFDYSGKGNKVELQGREDGAFKLKVTNRDKISTTFFIDPSTYYITKVVMMATMMGQDMEITRSYSNFQKTNYGYVLPFTIDINYGGSFNVTSTVKKVQVNKEVDAKIFDMPK
ncbi:MAG TPA: hypothetical protein VK543_15310 [Puia sp.]|nr:hypothetical protein [Puia sp.]